MFQLDGGIYPGAVEVCNGQDDNCDDTIDEDCDVGGIGDDIEESNSDSATLANITGLAIDPEAAPRWVWMVLSSRISSVSSRDGPFDS